ncbi:uncharacterized protein LOC134258075, partial [Saccostrea cucullata]|uniref:uncharacterized protein LOC134258075 n=1 Tax=Saccostrea cuccullata TaxID=36930 RepID=UPI002ED1E53A
MDLNLLVFLISISVFAIIGVIGNSLIIAVYIKTRRSFFNRTYIVALSIVDLIADLLIAPYTAVFELHLITSDVICHGMEVIRHTVIGFSNLILILIASERLLMKMRMRRIGSSSVLNTKQKPKKSETSQTTSSVPNDQSDCNSTDDMGLNLKSQPINNKHNRYDPGKTFNFCFKKNGFPVKSADSETDSGAISVTMTKFTSNKDIHGKQMRALSFDTDTTGVDSEPEKANGRNDR